MSSNDKPASFDQATIYAVNALAEFCVRLQKDGVPPAIVVYALDVNHAMGLRMTLDASFAALKAEGSTPASESPQGG